MAFIEVEEQSFEQTMSEEIAKGQTVILKFGAEWCDPCHALECELEDIDEDHENVSILDIDTDEGAAIAEHYGIHQLPTMMIFNTNNVMVHTSEGVMLAQDIEKILEDTRV